MNDIQKNINDGVVWSICDENNVIPTDYLVRLGDKWQRIQKERDDDFIIYTITDKTYDHIIDGLSNLVNESTPIGETPSCYEYSITLAQFAKLCGFNHPSSEQRAKIWRCLQILDNVCLKVDNWFHRPCVIHSDCGADAPKGTFQLSVTRLLKADEDDIIY